MKDGALGISSALIYPPNIYAKTDELIALAKVASKYGGLYATHMRSEGASEMAALAEAIRIGREANLPVEVFHLKVSGKSRWGNMKNVVATIQVRARFRPRYRREYVSVSRRRHGARLGSSAMGGRWRHAKTPCAPERSRRTRPHQRGIELAIIPTGKISITIAVAALACSSPPSKSPN